MTNKVEQTIGQKIKAAREDKGWDQPELAKRTKELDIARRGVKQQHISAIEGDRIKSPRHDTVKLLERALGIEL